MNQIKPYLLCGMLLLLFTHCKKDISQTTTDAGSRSSNTAVFETVISNSFSNYGTLEANWNYLYPRGSDHNGYAWQK